MRDLDKIINEYIEKTKSEHQIIAAMVTGSYLTKTMGANSGIDLFFCMGEGRPKHEGKGLL